MTSMCPDQTVPISSSLTHFESATSRFFPVYGEVYTISYTGGPYRGPWTPPYPDMSRRVPLATQGRLEARQP
jgi:hypothetical protein